MNKILGIPLKIASDNSVYIPKSFWTFYGFSTDDQVIREEMPDRIVFRCPWPRQLLPSEKILRVSQGRVHLRRTWLEQHKLAINDKVWLIGTRDGFIIYPRPIGAQIK